MVDNKNGFPGGVDDLISQAKEMQSQLEDAHTKAQTYTADGQSGGGMVKVVAQGNNRIVSIEINPDIISSDDVSMLQDMIIAACNDALANVQEKVQSDLMDITGGMSIPGLF